MEFILHLFILNLIELNYVVEGQGYLNSNEPSL